MGRGSSKIGGAGGSGGSSATMTIDQKRKAIDKTGFKDLGGGNWELDIPGVGGAQILDETGSSRAIRAGFMPGEKAYSYNAWGALYQPLSGLMPTVDILPTLNEAKDAARQLIKNHLS